MESVKRTAATAADSATPSSEEATAHVGHPSATDATWAAMMVPHHRTGIEMAEMAATKAATPDLQKLAAHSKAEQQEDMPRLEQILSAAGKDPMPPEPPIERLEKQQSKTLESLSGVEFDHHWVSIVSGHHTAAIMMADTALAGSTSPEATALQNEMREKQLAELDKLNDLRDRLGG